MPMNIRRQGSLLSTKKYINNGQIFYYAFPYEAYKVIKNIKEKEVKISYKKWLFR